MNLYSTLQTPPKFHEKTPREGRKNEISGGREKKKREILGPHPSDPTLWAPNPLGPHPFGPPPLRLPTPSGPHHPTRPPSHQKQKIGQMRSGQIRSTKIGQIRPNMVGQMRQLTLAKCGIGQIRFGQIRPRPTESGSTFLHLLICFFQETAACAASSAFVTRRSALSMKDRHSVILSDTGMTLAAARAFTNEAWIASLAATSASMRPPNASPSPVPRHNSPPGCGVDHNL